MLFHLAEPFMVLTEDLEGRHGEVCIKPDRVELLPCCEERDRSHFWDWGVGIVVYLRWSNSVYPMCNFKDSPI